jgi:quercetin dioxygenase-like cupin family protein
VLLENKTLVLKEKLMKRSLLIFGGVLATACALVITLVPMVLAQMAPPAESKGVAAKVIGALPLAPEIDSVDGRQLRMRVVTLAPGGVFAAHSHKDRPSVEYVLKGTATEFKGDARKVYTEGDAVVADKNTTHWWRNDGTEPAIFVAVDVFNPPK